MTKLQCKVMESTVTDEWLAKCYSEYLYACAEDQIDLNNAIADACDDEELNDLLDGYREVWDDNIEVLQQSMTAFALAKGILVADIQNRTPTYQVAMGDYQPDASALEAASNIANKYSNSWATGLDLISAMKTTALSSDTTLAEQQDVADKIESLANALAMNFDLDAGFKVALNEGFVDLRSLVANLITYTNLDSALPSFSITGYNSGDSSIGTLSLIGEDVISQLKNMVASNIAWAQGFASCAISNVSDRVTNYVESVQTAFSSAYTEASEVYNNVKAFLADTKCSVRSFIEQAEQMIGWDELINTDAIISDTDVAAYTGASPYNGINLHTAKGITTVVVRTIAAAGYAVWSGMKSIGMKLWGKVRPMAMAVTNDPEDFKIIDKNATSRQFDIWCYQGDQNIVGVRCTTRAEAQALAEYINSKAGGSTISYDCYFGSLQFVIDHCGVDVGPGDRTVFVEYSFRFKPKAVNYKALIDVEMFNMTYSNTQVTPLLNGTPQDFVSKIQSLASSDSIYLEASATEEEVASGLYYAIAAMYSTSIMSFIELSAQSNDATGSWDRAILCVGVDSTSENDVIKTFDFSNPVDVVLSALWFAFDVDGTTKLVNNVTNKEMLIAASGYIDTETTYGNGFYPNNNDAKFQMFHSHQNVDISIMVSMFVGFWLVQQNNRRENPGDFLFLPYTSNTWDFEPATYAIKTDYENAQVVDVFISALVIVAAIAIVVIVGAKVCRTIKKAKFKKWTRIKGELDNAMWNKVPLSKKQWRKYLRADKKLSKINLWSAGTSASNVVKSALGQDAAVAKTIDFVSNEKQLSSEQYVDIMSNKILGTIIGY